MSLIYGWDHKQAKSCNTSVGGLVSEVNSLKYLPAFVGSANAQEGDPNIKGTQLSHASAIASHANNLLEIEGIVGNSGSPDIQNYNPNVVGLLVPWVKRLKQIVGDADAGVGELVDEVKGILTNPIKSKIGWFRLFSGVSSPTVGVGLDMSFWGFTKNVTILAITIKAQSNLSGLVDLEIFSANFNKSTNTASNISVESITHPHKFTLATLKNGTPLNPTRRHDHTKNFLFVKQSGTVQGTSVDRKLTFDIVYLEHTPAVQ